MFRVDADEIVVREVEPHGCLKVLHLLAESVREARETPHAHPHGKVLPLNEAGRNVLAVWAALDHLFFGAHHVGRAVTPGPGVLSLVIFTTCP